MGIIKSFNTGDKGEKFVVSLFQNNGFNAEQNKNHSLRYEYDILCSKIDNKEQTFTLECKYDLYAQKSNNWCIELWNTKKNEASGLTVTKANIWCVILQDGDNMVSYICSVKNLREFVEKTPPFKSFNSAGDGNAGIILFRHDDIVKIFERIDNIDEKQFDKIINKVLKS